jgi:hypothetical protein
MVAAIWASCAALSSDVGLTSELASTAILCATVADQPGYAYDRNPALYAPPTITTAIMAPAIKVRRLFARRADSASLSMYHTHTPVAAKNIASAPIPKTRLWDMLPKKVSMRCVKG